MAGIPLNNKCFLKFIGLLVSWFHGFFVSSSQSIKDSQFPFHVLIDIDPILQNVHSIFRNILIPCPDFQEDIKTDLQDVRLQLVQTIDV